MGDKVSRRELLRNAALAAAALALPAPLVACGKEGAPPAGQKADPDLERLTSWTGKLYAEGLTGPETPLGRGAIRVGELAIGTPYVPYTLEAYLKGGGSPQEPAFVASSPRA